MRQTVSCFLAAAVLAVLTLLPANRMHAQVVTAPATPQVGSSNPATAAPLVPRPDTKPCVVQLFSNVAFENYTPATFSYTPPADCRGPWAKVVFTADFTVTAGIQYDRTAAFYLGFATNRANLYYGTTAEPSPTLSPSWHVERDVTDLSAIFKSDEIGEANIGNTVNPTYNGIIYASAALEFYPASFRDPAPRVPDIVVPVNGPGGDAGTLNTTTDTISQTLDLPTNVEKVYLDVIAQSQIGDEFWYLCAPTNVAAELETCGNTPFRETEVSIDGKAAGVAPVYPWIFTGGIDPFLWIPIPGNQTLDFKPYRVDLTPFAGLLSDGNSHTVAVSVFNANGYFLATANLLVYTDHDSRRTTGAVILNSLSAAPTPVVNERINYNSTSQAYSGTISVSSNRDFTIKGYIDTSHGRVETTVHQRVNFRNNSQYNVDPTVELQNLQQTSTVDSESTTQQGPFAATTRQHFSYPLNLDYSFIVNNDGSAAQKVSVDQVYQANAADLGYGRRFYLSNVNEETKAYDDLVFNADGSYGPQGARSSQTYQFNNSRGDCYSRSIASANNVLTDVDNGHGCRGGNW